ncbi:epoxide hydrolase [Halopseudomonas aestusnigri]|uniref:alpha/beta fold hydrolase n=1 Tax=Halopseudomonas TaxID=2901189 RepID=UPI0022B74F82|nr:MULTISPECIES: alpha/beta hydrolase [Halopseudomonas]BDX19953.1 epoxide hydrolase [Halopseudomonas aestusnigri]
MYCLDDIRFEQQQISGLSTRMARVGTGPVALFIHGWPECWYSWRQQMVALANAGYTAVAPDMPGFGETEALAQIDDYNVTRIAGFMQALVAHYSPDAPVLLIGHDWGAINSWQFVQLHPECVARLIIMSVPLRPVADVPPIEFLRGYFKDQFFYQIYFQDPGVAEAEFDADPEGILRALYCSPETPRHPPLLGKSLSEGGGWIGRLGVPKEQPAWLTDEMLAYCLNAYRHSGFAGGINYYRNLDENWRRLLPLRESKITCPVLFIAGEADSVIQGADEPALRAMMGKRIPSLQIELLPKIGHWLQNEAPEAVNEAMLRFLQQP